MSLFVKGMHLPSNCYECDFKKFIYRYRGIAYCGITGQEVTSTARHQACQLMELSTPHGALVDKEKVIATCKREICASCNDNVAGRCTGSDSCGVLKALNIIAMSPTVIEAEHI